jgi:hypothetical protein
MSNIEKLYIRLLKEANSNKIDAIFVFWILSIAVSIVVTILALFGIKSGIALYSFMSVFVCPLIMFLVNDFGKFKLQNFEILVDNYSKIQEDDLKFFVHLSATLSAIMSKTNKNNIFDEFEKIAIQYLKYGDNHVILKSFAEKQGKFDFNRISSFVEKYKAISELMNESKLFDKETIKNIMSSINEHNVSSNYDKINELVRQNIKVGNYS